MKTSKVLRAVRRKVEKRPAETAGVISIPIGAALALVLGELLGFRDDTELQRAVDIVIMAVIGLVPAIVTRWKVWQDK